MITHRYIYSNKTGGAVTVTIEPWAEWYTVHPGQTIHINFSGTLRSDLVLSNLHLEIEDHPDGLTIFPGYGAAEFSVTDEQGRELVPFSDEPPPRAAGAKSPPPHPLPDVRGEGVIARAGRLVRRLWPVKPLSPPGGERS